MIGDKIRNKIKVKIRGKVEEKSGFTLVEVLVSVVLFTMIILSVTNIFKMAIDAQRNAIATQNVQESLKYFFEVTGKEMRMALKNKNDGRCLDIPVGSVYKVESSTNGDELFFRNYYNECVTYFLEKDYNDSMRFAIKREAPGLTRVDFISPEKININSIRFVVKTRGYTPESQPMVTMSFNASSFGDSKISADMTVQTSITSRYYKKD